MLSGLALKVVVGLAAAAVGVGGVLATVSSPDGDEAQVVRVIDGDTIDVSVAGSLQRVRLLNVDTPETKDPDEAVQCLGPEAAEYLTALLPVGATVQLSYDVERLDRFGRVLAGVRTEDDELVNAELAARGLGVAVPGGPNQRFYPDVLAAQEQARDAQVGLYTNAVTCTLPAKVAAAEQAAAVGVPPSNPVALDGAADLAETTVASAVALRSWFDGPRLGLVWAAFSRLEQDRLATRVDAVRDSARTAAATWRERAIATRAAEAEALRAAAQARREAEAQRRAQERAAEAASAEQRRLASAAAAASRQAAERAEQSGSGSPGVGSSAPSSSGSDGYTGRRCYAPGGKTYRPC